MAKSDQLARENSRVQITADGRYLVVARSGGRLYAFDATCYHMGAPLLHGDIEDVAGHGACITCPWHHYQISMSSGERLYQDMSRKTCTLPKKQRVHAGVVEHIDKPDGGCSCEWGFGSPRGLAEISKDESVCPTRDSTV